MVPLASSNISSRSRSVVVVTGHGDLATAIYER